MVKKLGTNLFQLLLSSGMQSQWFIIFPCFYFSDMRNFLNIKYSNNSPKKKWIIYADSKSGIEAWTISRNSNLYVTWRICIQNYLRILTYFVRSLNILEYLKAKLTKQQKTLHYWLHDLCLYRTRIKLWNMPLWDFGKISGA